jgi:hypothetical protein
VTEPAGMSFEADRRWLPIDVGADPRQWCDRTAASIMGEVSTADAELHRQLLSDKLFLLVEVVHRHQPTLAFVIRTAPTRTVTVAEVFVGDLPDTVVVQEPADLAPYFTLPTEKRMGDVRQTVVRTASGPAVRLHQGLITTVAGERVVLGQVSYAWHVPSQHAMVILSALVGDGREAREVLPILDALAAGFHADSDVQGVAP